MAYLENHQLYYKKSCPFCQKVLRFMDEHKITMDTRDTLQPGYQNDLVRIGGKKQVPCLVINQDQVTFGKKNIQQLLELL